MKTRMFNRCADGRRLASGERGVTVVIALIALVVLLISGVALIRSFDTSLLMAGNLSFKRDLVNQGERGLRKVSALLTSGALVDETTRNSNLATANYSAVALASDSHGLPTILSASDANFAAAMTGADLVDTDSQVQIRYVIDRQCASTGAFDASTCLTTPTASDKAGTAWIKRAGGERRPVYRISVRVKGPRNTEVYLQSAVVL